MSLSSISSQLLRTVEQNQNIEQRLHANQGGGSTMSKVAAVAISLFVSIGALVLGGPVAGLVVALICGVSLLALFNACCPSGDMFGTRFMNGIPPNGGHDHGRGHVPPPRGGPNVRGHVAVGGGHFHPAPAGGHVPVGRGHAPVHGHAPVGGGHAPVHGHAPVGGGHAPVGGGHHPGHGPTDAPPPSGPGGHVPVGRGRR